jgi:hypothetical protein
VTKIYLASSWRNESQQRVLAQLRAEGHDVYDFRNPASVIRDQLVDTGDRGFGRRQILEGPIWRQILEGPIDTAQKLRGVLAHPIAEGGFGRDFDAMKWGQACVLLLPCGNSAHLEAGWMAGMGKPVIVLAPELREPELMYKCFDTRPSLNLGRIERDREDPGGDAASGWQTPIFTTVNEVIAFLPQVVTP